MTYVRGFLAASVCVLAVSGTAVADTQTKTVPATVVNEVYGAVSWSVPLPSATGGLSMSATTSTFLKATDFGFTIPTGAVIDGIEVGFTKEADNLVDTNTIFDAVVSIVKGGAIAPGDRSNGIAWPGSAALVTHGTPTDLWGETWSVSDVNAADFGAAIACEYQGAFSDIARVNAIQITVHYTLEVDHYTGYKIGVAKTNLALTPITQSLPEPWNITLDDVFVSNADGDDPENFEATKAKELLLPAEKNGEGAPLQPDLHYMSYQIGAADEGVGPDLGDGFPKPAKRLNRAWALTNQFGTISVNTSKPIRLWVPTEKDLSTPPASPAADATHWICYKAKTAAAYKDQTPGTCSSASGPFEGQSCLDDSSCGGMVDETTLCVKPKFRKDIQAFFKNQFDDCANNSLNNVQFPSTPVEGECMITLKKPSMLCSPATKSAVVAPRVTAASISGSTPSITDQALLCYQVGLAKKILSASAVSFIGSSIGQPITPQAKPASATRIVKKGSAVFTYPGNGFDQPRIVEKPKLGMLCVPSDVNSVAILP